MHTFDAIQHANALVIILNIVIHFTKNTLDHEITILGPNFYPQLVN
jgi:hypothetical protein